MHLTISGNLNLTIKDNYISSEKEFLLEQRGNLSLHLFSPEFTNHEQKEKCFFSKLFSIFSKKESIGLKEFFLSESITSLTISGASDAIFLSPFSFKEIKVSGSSKLALVETSSTFDIVVSGSSYLSIKKIESKDLHIKCSGSSELFILGEIENSVRINCSGSSSISGKITSKIYSYILSGSSKISNLNLTGEATKY